MIRQAEELVAAGGGGAGHLLDRRLAVGRPGRMTVHLAAQVAELDEPRQRSRPGRLELAAVLAQLRRDEAVPEEGVERLLVAERPHLARLDDGDPVLGDREPVPLGLLPQRHVVVFRAREVLKQIAVALRRHDAEIEAEALRVDHGRLRVAVGDDLEHPGQSHEVSRQRGGIGCGRDHVEIAEGLAAPSGTARLGDVDRRRVGPERRDRLADDREPLAEETAPRLLRALALRERLQDLRLRGSTDPRERPQALSRGSLLQLGECRDAELAPDPGCRLRVRGPATAGRPRPPPAPGRAVSQGPPCRPSR